VIKTHLAQTKPYLQGKWFGGGAKAKAAATTVAKGSDSNRMPGKPFSLSQTLLLYFLLFSYLILTCKIYSLAWIIRLR